MKTLFTKFIHRHDGETEIDKNRRGFHLKYHIKNLFRIGILFIAYWIILVAGALYITPHLVGYVAGMLRITYDSEPLDIIIWGFCSLFAVLLILVGFIWFMRWLKGAWNSLFVTTIAEGKALKRLHEEREAEEQKKFMERFGFVEEMTDSSCETKCQKKRKK